MAPTHGITAASKLISAPRSRSFEGPFGRLFRNLPPWEPDGKNEAEKIANIAVIAAEMDEAKAGPNETGDNETIPAGYTYFGQFIDHDLTFDPRSSLQKHNDPEALVDFRSPAFDLDCLYGRGPDDQPYMYEDDGSFRITKLTTREGEKPGEVFDDDDLPRHGVDPKKGRALIGDKRNDENTFVSQLQLIFLKFHNAVLNDASAGGNDFEKTQRIVRWHYQWVVVHDWLKKLCGETLINKMLANGDCPSKPKLCYYNFHEYPFMPLEFSVAAYRLGHSMVRGRYRINNQIDLKPVFSQQGNEADFSDFRGFRTLPAGWTIDWSFFFNFSPLAAGIAGNVPKPEPKPAMSRKIDRFLVSILTKLPDSIAKPGDAPTPDPEPAPNIEIERSLAYRNLLRGWRLALPSGQAVAALLGVTQNDTRMDLQGNAPLWRYILDEAGLDGQGERLGPVGATIVAETFLGLLAADPSSYLRNNPLWQPNITTPIGSQFELRDIIHYAGGRIKS